MIKVFGVCYRMLEYAKTSIKSIRETASEPIQIYVCDNFSPKSEQIRSHFEDNLEIDGLLCPEANVKGWGLSWLAQILQPRNDLFFFTDLDIVVDFDWIKEARRIQDYVEVSGFSLKTDNYVPPNSGFDQNVREFGTWLMGIDPDPYFFSNLHLQPHLDSNLLKTLGSYDKSPMQLTHLGWNIWKDDPEYWQEKVKGVDWKAPPASFAFSFKQWKSKYSKEI